MDKERFYAGASAATAFWLIIWVIWSGAHRYDSACGRLYGYATKEHALCVYEMEQHLRDKP